jgi:holliday junction DNA helicase RuvA
MIGFLKGKVLFSDGRELIMATPSGVGYQIFFNDILVEGSTLCLYISHIIRENSEDLYGFFDLRSKKMFELLIGVKGVGPKSAYTLLTGMGTERIINSIQAEDKKAISSVKGIGPKASAQIILDIAKKVYMIRSYSNKRPWPSTDYEVGEDAQLDNLNIASTSQNKDVEINAQNEESDDLHLKNEILHEALLACKELGFNESKVVPLAQEILAQHKINKTEQLVHLVLKGI